MLCLKCGGELGSDARFCIGCGTPVAATSEATLISQQANSATHTTDSNEEKEKEKKGNPMWGIIKGKASDTVNSLKDSATTAKDSIGNFSLSNTVKDFAVKSAQVVSEIDEQLTKAGSTYEVATFRVSANAGVIAGMVLDISFAKTVVAKNMSNEKRVSLSIENPISGKIIRILRSALGTKEIAMVRDPSTGDILQVNVKTGKVISVNQKQVEK